MRKPRPSAQKYRDGLDEGAVLGMLESYGAARQCHDGAGAGRLHDPDGGGFARNLRRQIEAFLRDCDIDGLMFVYDDYPQGLRVTGREILPQLRRAFA